MKKMQCEMCGSSDFIKENGVFTCQNCGCKYSPEEAKKLILDGNVVVSGRMKIDESDKIINYYTLAEEAFLSEDSSKALSYCNKILENDCKFYKAWLLKAKITFLTELTSKGNKAAMTSFAKACDFSAQISEDEKQNVLKELCNTVYDYFENLTDKTCTLSIPAAHLNRSLMQNLHKFGADKLFDREKLEKIIDKIHDADDFFCSFCFDLSGNHTCKHYETIRKFAQQIIDLLNSDLLSDTNKHTLTETIFAWLDKQVDDVSQNVKTLDKLYLRDHYSTTDERDSCCNTLDAMALLLKEIDADGNQELYNSICTRFEEAVLIMCDWKWYGSGGSYNFSDEAIAAWRKKIKQVKQKYRDLSNDEAKNDTTETVVDEETPQATNDTDNTTETNSGETSDNTTSEKLKLQNERKQKIKELKSQTKFDEIDLCNKICLFFFGAVLVIFAGIFIYTSISDYNAYKVSLIEHYLKFSQPSKTRFEIQEKITASLSWRNVVTSCETLKQKIKQIKKIKLDSVVCKENKLKDGILSKADFTFFAQEAGPLSINIELDGMNASMEKISIIDVTSFAQALKEGNTQKVSEMMKRDGYSFEKTYIDGVTALEYLLDKNEAMVIWMLDNGLDANTYTKTGITLLMHATIHNKTKLFDKLLASEQTKVNLTDKKGRTALMFAAIKGRKSMVEKLIKANADIYIADNSKKTAYKYAQLANNSEIAKILGSDKISVYVFSDFCNQCKNKIKELKQILKKYPTASLDIQSKESVYERFPNYNGGMNDIIIFVCSDETNRCSGLPCWSSGDISILMGKGK